MVHSKPCRTYKIIRKDHIDDEQIGECGTEKIYASTAKWPSSTPCYCQDTRVCRNRVIFLTVTSIEGHGDSMVPHPNGGESNNSSRGNSQVHKTAWIGGLFMVVKINFWLSALCYKTCGVSKYVVPYYISRDKSEMSSMFKNIASPLVKKDKEHGF